jgi:hypothetical protein
MFILTISVFLLQFTTTHAHVTCDQCSLIAADIASFAANNTDIAAAVKLLETEYCDVKYKSKPIKKLACDAVAKGLGSLVKVSRAPRNMFYDSFVFPSLALYLLLLSVFVSLSLSFSLSSSDTFEYIHVNVRAIICSIYFSTSLLI